MSTQKQSSILKHGNSTITGMKNITEKLAEIAREHPNARVGRKKVTTSSGEKDVLGVSLTGTKGTPISEFLIMKASASLRKTLKVQDVKAMSGGWTQDNFFAAFTEFKNHMLIHAPRDANGESDWMAKYIKHSGQVLKVDSSLISKMINANGYGGDDTMRRETAIKKIRAGDFGNLNVSAEQARELSSLAARTYLAQTHDGSYTLLNVPETQHVDISKGRTNIDLITMDGGKKKGSSEHVVKITTKTAKGAVRVAKVYYTNPNNNAVRLHMSHDDAMEKGRKSIESKAAAQRKKDAIAAADGPVVYLPGHSTGMSGEARDRLKKIRANKRKFALDELKKKHGELAKYMEEKEAPAKDIFAELRKKTGIDIDTMPDSDFA